MGAQGIIRASGCERPKYEREIITQRVRREGEETGSARTSNMLTPLVCVPVHFY